MAVSAPASRSRTWVWASSMAVEARGAGQAQAAQGGGNNGLRRQPCISLTAKARRSSEPDVLVFVVTGSDRT
jgi:hypothetical protein